MRLQLPTALQWSHNDYYHPFLLRHVPPGAHRALDVGCGTGVFARELSHRVALVDAIDRSGPSVELARERSKGIDNIHYEVADFFGANLPDASYDFVSCVAVIHHMPFADAAERMRRLLAPGGTAAVLGICRDAPPSDYARHAVTLPLNVLMGLRFAVGRALGAEQRVTSGHGGEAPVLDPTMTLADVRHETAAHFPGATIKRHLFWRYSLIYTANEPTSAR